MESGENTRRTKKEKKTGWWKRQRYRERENGNERRARERRENPGRERERTRALFSRVPGFSMGGVKTLRLRQWRWFRWILRGHDSLPVAFLEARQRGKIHGKKATRARVVCARHGHWPGPGAFLRFSGTFKGPMVRRCHRERWPRVIDKLESPLLARGLLLHPLELAQSFCIGEFCYLLNLLNFILIKFYKLDTLFNSDLGHVDID